MRTRFILTALLAFALLLWLLRGVDLASVWTHVRSADRASMLGGLVFVALTYVTRAIRWQYLLAPLGHTRFRTAFRTTVIGFAVLTLLPLRVGDVLRGYLLARKEGLTASATLATIAMERILDLMAVLALLGVYLWVVPYAQELSPEAIAKLAAIKLVASVCAAACVVLMAVMWALATHPARAASLVLFVEHFTSRRVALAFSRYVGYFSAGFAAVRSPGRLALAGIWSVLLWLVIAGETWIVSRGFGIPMDFTGSFVMQPLLVLGVAVGTPGGLGPYQWAYVVGVTLFFGASQETAVASSFVVWVISFIPVVLVGLVFMAQDGLSVGRLETLASEARG
jgi:uncharacterized protein (TIRG00374 family)